MVPRAAEGPTPTTTSTSTPTLHGPTPTPTTTTTLHGPTPTPHGPTRTRTPTRTPTPTPHGPTRTRTRSPTSTLLAPALLAPALLALALTSAACLPSFAPLADCYIDTDCPAEQRCLSGQCTPAALDAGTTPTLDATTPTLDATTPTLDAGTTPPPDAGTTAPPDSGLRCPDGPYGTGHLYFGAPVPAPIFDGAKGTGALSADGRHFIKGEGGVCPDCYDTLDYLRWSIDAAWTPSAFRIYFWADRLHLSADARLLYGCHGGELKCGFHTRASELDPFRGDADYSFFDLPGFDVSVTSAGGAIDYAMIPTPDGRTVAFASNRRSAAEDLASGLPDLETTDLWTAELVVPGDPRAGFTHLARHPAASSPSGRDLPAWIADDASMVLLETRLPGEVDTDVVLTSSVAGTFGRAERVEILSDPLASEDGVSLPSLATLRALGGHGSGYLRRTPRGGAPAYYAFPVCVGSPDP